MIIPFLWQDFADVSMLRPRCRHVLAHVITMPQSGSHWLNNMLAAGICREYGIREPAHIRDRSIIRRPVDPIVYPEIPRIVQSHFVPSVWVHLPWLVSRLQFPKYVLLIRDIRASLVSHYEKRQMNEHALSFSDYLHNRGLRAGRKIRRDLWHRMRFLNAWGRDVRRLPEDQTIVVRYEDLKADPGRQVERVWEFLGLPSQTESFYARVVNATSKERMARRESPDVAYKIVRRSDRHPFDWFSEPDRVYFSNTARRHLRDSFGYDYDDWTYPPAETARAA